VEHFLIHQREVGDSISLQETIESQQSCVPPKVHVLLVATSFSFRERGECQQVCCVHLVVDAPPENIRTASWGEASVFVVVAVAVVAVVVSIAVESAVAAGEIESAIAAAAAAAEPWPAAAPVMKHDSGSFENRSGSFVHLLLLCATLGRVWKPNPGRRQSTASNSCSLETIVGRRSSPHRPFRSGAMPPMPSNTHGGLHLPMWELLCATNGAFTIEKLMVEPQKVCVLMEFVIQEKQNII